MNIKEKVNFTRRKILNLTLESKSQFINCPSLQIKSFLNMNTVYCRQRYYKVKLP